MTMLFHAHSGLRYLVLLAGIIAVAAFLIGLLRRRDFGGAGPGLLAAYTGLVDLQIVLGLVLFALGRRVPGIEGHLALMILAAAVLHGASIARRRRSQPTGYGLPLVGVVGSLMLIVLGILAIGRGIV